MSCSRLAYESPKRFWNACARLSQLPSQRPA